MKEKEIKIYQDLAKELVTPERFLPMAGLALTVALLPGDTASLFPDLPALKAEYGA